MVTDRRADNSLREEDSSLIGSRGRIVKVALSYYMDALEGDISQCMSGMGWEVMKHGYQD